MGYWQRKLLGRAVTYALATILLVISFVGMIRLMWRPFGPPAVLIAAIETWLLSFAWITPLVKLEMWISRPRPIKTMKGLAEMAADDARRKARRQRYRRMFSWKGTV